MYVWIKKLIRPLPEGSPFKFKDYYLSPPRLFAVKNIFCCFIKFLSPNIMNTVTVLPLH